MQEFLDLSFSTPSSLSLSTSIDSPRAKLNAGLSNIYKHGDKVCLLRKKQFVHLMSPKSINFFFHL
jgi:hypothetical protein